MMRIAVILLTLFISNGVMADVYKFVDSNGLTYYTDEPRHSLYKRIIKTKTVSYSFKNYPTKVRNYTGANKQRFAELIEQAASKYQVDSKLVHAVIQTESAYN